ncbi:glycosyltransferase family 2 protein [Sporobolomyces salmoneus]|uniref:glycosyltransferase family 2 protein n=1 Tax=Sporobolomyces salmoneus TaxID=183962 RepID=UPI003172CA49
MLYLTSDHFSFFLPLGLIGVFRYLWFIIRLLAAWSYKPIPIPKKPTYFPQEDVTIVVPTIDSDAHFLTAMRSWLVGQPYEIIIITTFAVLPALEELAAEMNREDAEKNPEMVKEGMMGRDGKGRVRVFGVEKANKRKQMVEGIKRTQTDIIVFADDDAIWPARLLSYVLACFEDLSIGGVGTSQVVAPLRATGKLTVWETLAAFRLSIRNVEIAASSYLDGGIPCLSGRTAAYRSIILKDPEFITQFTNDYWRGKYHLNSGDDKFLTRWCVSHGWKTWVQVTKGAELKSTMKDDWTFLKQVLRWTRNTWRSDLRSIFIERHIWTAHPYVAYSMIDKFLNPFTLLAGPALVIFLCARSASNDPVNGVYILPVWNILLSWCVWLTATRTAKLAPHLWNRPGDVIYVPMWVAFGYYFSVMKLYALFTLHEVGWGTRAGIDTNDNKGDGAPSTTTATRSFNPNSPPPFPGVMASFPSQSPSYHTLATHPPPTSTAQPSPNPLPTSSPTSTYPSSPPGTYPHQHETYGYSTTLILDPLSPPRIQPQFDSPGQGITDSPFQRLEVPSATDEQWREWERVTKEAMEKFEKERRSAQGQGQNEERREADEGEEISFNGGEEGQDERRGEGQERQEDTIRLVG